MEFVLVFYQICKCIFMVFYLILCFEAMSVLKTNLAKLELVPERNVDNVAGWLEFWVVGLRPYP